MTVGCSRCEGLPFEVAATAERERERATNHEPAIAAAIATASMAANLTLALPPRSMQSQSVAATPGEMRQVRSSRRSGSASKGVQAASGLVDLRRCFDGARLRTPGQAHRRRPRQLKVSTSAREKAPS